MSRWVERMHDDEGTHDCASADNKYTLLVTLPNLRLTYGHSGAHISSHPRIERCRLDLCNKVDDMKNRHPYVSSKP